MAMTDEERKKMEEIWRKTCRENGWVCSECGLYPPKLGISTGYETGICPACRIAAGETETGL